jgi:hypothetical protein
MQELNDAQLEQVVGGTFGGYGLYAQVFPPVSTGANVYANAYANGVNSANTFTSARSVSGPVGGGSLSLGFGFGSALAR